PIHRVSPRGRSTVSMTCRRRSASTSGGRSRADPNQGWVGFPEWCRSAVSSIDWAYAYSPRMAA
ncbi:MAG: hypothetical protein ACYC2Z_11780, partial [Candidatus Nanopelagicales bacterium]